MNTFEANQPTQKLLQSALEIRQAIRLMEWLKGMVLAGKLKAGDRIPSKCALSRQLHINPSGVQTGIEYLSILGIMKLRRHRGAFLAASIKDLSELAADTNIDADKCDLRYLLEVVIVSQGNLAALAAVRSQPSHRAALAEELTELFASVENAREFLIHEMSFYRIVAQAAGNPILSVLTMQVTSASYSIYRDSPACAQNARASAERYRKIFRAIRDGKPVEACAAMEDHLRIAQAALGLPPTRHLPSVERKTRCCALEATQP